MDQIYEDLIYELTHMDKITLCTVIVLCSVFSAFITLCWSDFCDRIAREKKLKKKKTIKKKGVIICLE